jgi:hypothetical protein
LKLEHTTGTAKALRNPWPAHRDHEALRAGSAGTRCPCESGHKLKCCHGEGVLIARPRATASGNGPAHVTSMRRAARAKPPVADYAAPYTSGSARHDEPTYGIRRTSGVGPFKRAGYFLDKSRMAWTSRLSTALARPDLPHLNASPVRVACVRHRQGRRLRHDHSLVFMPGCERTAGLQWPAVRVTPSTLACGR